MLTAPVTTLPKTIVDGLAISPEVLPGLLAGLDALPVLLLAVVDALLMLVAPPPPEQPDTNAAETERINKKIATPRPMARVAAGDAVGNS